MSAVEAEQELEQRLALVTPGDTVLGMFFRSVRETVQELKGPEAAEACFAECGERKFVDFFAYPGADFLRLLKRSAGMMGEEGEGFEGALRRLGYLGTMALLKSQAGQAVKVVISGTPRRILDNMPMGYRVTTPAGGGCKVALVGQRGGRLILERDVVPRPYVEGSLEAHFRKEGAQGLRIAGKVTGPLSSEYELTWE